MEIYKLVHKSWNRGMLSDFDLPRTIGHFSTRTKAELVRDGCIQRTNSVFKSGPTESSCFVATIDYEIVTIRVL